MSNIKSPTKINNNNKVPLAKRIRGVLRIFIYYIITAVAVRKQYMVMLSVFN